MTTGTKLSDNLKPGERANGVQFISTFAAVARELSKACRSKKELRELTGITPATALKWIRVLHQPHLPPEVRMNLIYIEAWRKHPHGQVSPLFRWGFCMPDAPRPAPKTSSQKGKDYRLRRKQRDAERDRLLELAKQLPTTVFQLGEKENPPPRLPLTRENSAAEGDWK